LEKYTAWRPPTQTTHTATNKMLLTDQGARNQKAESRKQKAESRKQKAESKAQLARWSVWQADLAGITS